MVPPKIVLEFSGLHSSPAAPSHQQGRPHRIVPDLQERLALSRRLHQRRGRAATRALREVPQSPLAEGDGALRRHLLRRQVARGEDRGQDARRPAHRQAHARPGQRVRDARGSTGARRGEPGPESGPRPDAAPQLGRRVPVRLRRVHAAEHRRARQHAQGRHHHDRQHGGERRVRL